MISKGKHYQTNNFYVSGLGSIIIIHLAVMCEVSLLEKLVHSLFQILGVGEVTTILF